MMFCSVPNCKYPNFAKDKITGLPYCRTHQTKRTDFDRRSIIQKAMDKQSRLQGQIRSFGNEAKVEDNKLELWFLMVENVIRSNPTCWNCGEPINEYYDERKKKMVNDFRNSSAHIFPKAQFPSVATHPLNFLVLGCRCGCHDDSHRLDKFSKMQVFGMAIDRFIVFEDLITEKHKYLNEFKMYAQNYKR